MFFCTEVKVYSSEARSSFIKSYSVQLLYLLEIFPERFLPYRLNSAIIGTPITLFSTNYHYTHTPAASSRGRGKWGRGAHPHCVGSTISSR